MKSLLKNTIESLVKQEKDIDQVIKTLDQYEYSEKDIYELYNFLSDEEGYVFQAERLLGKLLLDVEFREKLLTIGKKKDRNVKFLMSLYVFLYNSGKTIYFSDILNLTKSDKLAALRGIAKIQFQSSEQIAKILDVLLPLELIDIKLARIQISIISTIARQIEGSEVLRNRVLENYLRFIEDGTTEIREMVIYSIYSLKGEDMMKYKLLWAYIAHSNNNKIIEDYFYNFDDPLYLFDFIQRSFSFKPTYRFNVDLFRRPINHFLNTQKEKVEEFIIDLFSDEENPIMGLLAVKIFLICNPSIQDLNLLKIKTAQGQINGLNRLIYWPHSIDKLLQPILSLRNSEFEEVRQTLEDGLKEKVFFSYHETIIPLMEKCLTQSENDLRFLDVMKEVVEQYNQLKDIKSSIKDLDPNENEKDLMDFFYAIEYENRAKMIHNIPERGFLASLGKSSIIVRGNSFKHEGRETPLPLARIETRILVDSEVFLNPELYESKLDMLWI